MTREQVDAAIKPLLDTPPQPQFGQRGTTGATSSHPADTRAIIPVEIDGGRLS